MSQCKVANSREGKKEIQQLIRRFGSSFHVLIWKKKEKLWAHNSARSIQSGFKPFIPQTEVYNSFFFPSQHRRPVRWYGFCSAVRSALGPFYFFFSLVPNETCLEMRHKILIFAHSILWIMVGMTEYVENQTHTPPNFISPILPH